MYPALVTQIDLRLRRTLVLHIILQQRYFISYSRRLLLQAVFI